MTSQKFNREVPPNLDEPWTLGDLRKWWSHLVGPAAANISRPIYLDRHTGKLLLFVETDPWTVELNSMIPDEWQRILPAHVDGVRLRTLHFQTRQSINADCDTALWFFSTPVE